jgi:diaminopimelate decarboxylase
VSGGAARGALAALRRRAGVAIPPLVRRLAGDDPGPPPLEPWGLSRDHAGRLVVGGVELEGLADRHGSPVHVVDRARLDRNAAAFTAPAPGAAVEIACSYKTNPVPGVLAAVHARGIGAEVVSAYELWLALRLGVPPASIVYNGPAKSPASVREALARGVGLLNLNARAELEPIAAAARQLGVRAPVGLRVSVPGTWGGQFGERIDTGAALEAFREAAGRPELEVLALHAHPGEEIATRARLEAVLGGALAFLDRLHATLGLSIRVLDLGGNLAAPTVAPLPERARRRALRWGIAPSRRPPGAVLGIRPYVEAVAAAVDRHFRAAGRPAPRVVLEPGRALLGDAQLLVATVLQRVAGGSGCPDWLVLDVGTNGAEPVRSEWHALVPLTARAGAPLRTYRVTGPSCMKGDVLYPAARLPELGPGDRVAILDAGAYFVPFSTCFSFPRAAIVEVADGREELLRRAESFEDLVLRDHAPWAEEAGALRAAR